MIDGIHHITAIAGDPQENINFYINVLGLRFIKKTVNFDDPHTYHFYFGNEVGSPGTILTFFPWTSGGIKGRRGVGQIITISFSVPQNALSYWIERLKKFNFHPSDIFKKFGEDAILFEDYDGFQLELISSKKELREGWNNGDVPSKFSIRGFHGAVLFEESSERTAELLTKFLGFRKMGEEEDKIRFECGKGGAGTYVDIYLNPNSQPGRMGVGAVHHIAWRVKNDDEQIKIQSNLLDEGYNVTDIVDRNYFHSIYFREPGNILFEVATDPPGFLIDEKKEELGTHLKLPAWLEGRRSEIEGSLPQIKIPELNIKH